MLAAARAVGASGVERFAHGTTVATNALLERRGARTAYVGNAGFEHLLHLRRQTRAHLYRLCAQHPEPLVPLERCHGVGGRLGPDGELEPLGEIPDIGDAEAVAVCLLFSFRDATHETAVAAELRRRHPGVAGRRVARGGARVPRVRAGVNGGGGCVSRSVVGRYSMRSPRARVGGATGAARDALVRRRGDGRRGGCASGDDPRLRAGCGRRRRRPRRAPRRLRGCDRVRHGRDVDRCVPVPGGRAARVAERDVGGLPVRLTTVDLHTVGAGGGSLVRVDAGGAIRVGPESAGARPGPACYGAGGGATVTDANLLLGRLPAELPGGLVLDREAAARALDRHRSRLR